MENTASLRLATVYALRGLGMFFTTGGAALIAAGSGNITETMK